MELLSRDWTNHNTWNCTIFFLSFEGTRRDIKYRIWFVILKFQLSLWFSFETVTKISINSIRLAPVNVSI